MYCYDFRSRTRAREQFIPCFLIVSRLRIVRCARLVLLLRVHTSEISRRILLYCMFVAARLILACHSVARDGARPSSASYYMYYIASKPLTYVINSASPAPSAHVTLACPLHNYGAILSPDHAHPTTPVPLPVQCKLLLSAQRRHFKQLPALFNRFARPHYGVPHTSPAWPYLAGLRCRLVAGPHTQPYDPSPVARAVQASPLCTAPSLQAATHSLPPFCASLLRRAPYLARLALRIDCDPFTPSCHSPPNSIHHPVHSPSAVLACSPGVLLASCPPGSSCAVDDASRSPPTPFSIHICFRVRRAVKEPPPQHPLLLPSRDGPSPRSH